mmetsp:Transcript_36666/g.85308  ORF Transcript_36666/g.85308 Transcript_36666/m.85308 type:complete len:224 (+) Transcript_36666:74-745(+)|eukprot:CAMPEP_0171090408 /NCGR_PEP_ID=MMETSP0766_2-20121228/30787_1 /TAXON_ID=439317 /ORGANISM="Gambierdiscus australes, Strain CAWD 149" /LENGTH=223 /DNA_ID=CAMNT_0011548393 /DNA_START=58 /DNA_END=729 /DNA_ORIENTATION=+
MTVTQKAALLAWAGSCALGEALKLEVENGVYKLEESNFDQALEKFPALMVKFYAPWCGHCKALAPKYEKAARKLKKRDVPGPRLAKVDATVEEKLAKKYDVTGYPTLLVFKGGKLYGQYTGGRDKDDIVQYLDSLTLPFIVGDVVRLYQGALGIYKDVVRTAVPARFRRYLFALFPVLLFLPFLSASACWLCCRGRAKASSDNATVESNAKEGATSSEAKKED